MEKLQWSAFEYEEKNRTSDWFWALGVIVITSSIASIIYSNYFFAILLLFSGGLLGFFAKKKPELINYELNEHALIVRHKIFQYSHIKSFWVQHEDTMKNLPSVLFIKTRELFMPNMSIPIHKDMEEMIQNIFISQNVTEEKMEEHPILKITEILGF
jgi:hypothetical protein